jgi:DNA-binding NtrC family response regulator
VLQVLVLDNDPAMRDLLALAIQHQEMNPRLAGSVTEAEQELAKGDLDMMVLDLNLGGGHTGVSLALDWQKRGCLIPFVIVTGTPKHESLAELNGLNQYFGLLPKPFPIVDLLASLREMAPS